MVIEKNKTGKRPLGRPYWKLVEVIFEGSEMVLVADYSKKKKKNENVNTRKMH